MFDQTFVDRLAQALVARIIPQLQGGGNGSNGNGWKQPLKKLLTIKEAAQYIGRSETAVYRLVGRHQIPVVRNGRTLRFDRAELDRWVEADKV
jgi:excisionase family DNA binding protein